MDLAKITPTVFYKAGTICFSIVAICSVANYFIYFDGMNFFSRLGGLASTIFNLFLAGFFYYLLKTQVVNLPVETEVELEEALEEFKK